MQGQGKGGSGMETSNKKAGYPTVPGVLVSETHSKVGPLLSVYVCAPEIKSC